MYNTSSEIRNTIRTHILTNFLFGFSESELKDDSSFLELGVLDSTGIMEMISFLEQQFQIHISDEEILPENLDTIDYMVNFISTKIVSDQRT